MKTLVELLNSGVIKKIELKETCLGHVFNVVLSFPQSCIYDITLNVGTGKSIEAVVNAIVDSIDTLPKDESSETFLRSQDNLAETLCWSKLPKNQFDANGIEDMEEEITGEALQGAIDS